MKMMIRWLSEYQERENSNRGLYTASTEVVIERNRTLLLLGLTDRLKSEIHVRIARERERERHRLQNLTKRCTHLL